jgi:dUTP pyrophosphatase
VTESGWAQHEKEKDEAQDQEAEKETALVSRPDGQRYIIKQYEGDGQMVKRYFEVISEFEELPKDERPVLPKRQTKNSAGYDFYCIRDTLVQKGWGALLRTGIKVHMPPDEHLEIHIRSSYGMKYGMRLANGVGIIDADYYNNPDNEGEILVKLINDGDGDVMIHKGDRFAQGIFVKHFLTDNDNATGERVGGVGSTSETN